MAATTAFPNTPKASSHDNNTLSKVVKAKDTSFTVYYFDLHTHGATPRAILAYMDANWKLYSPVDWTNPSSPEKSEAIYGTLPLMYEYDPKTGATLEIAEAMNIELYLAQKFNLLGDNDAEAIQIRAAYSNSRALMHRQEDTYFARKPHKAVERERFINEFLKQWIRTHESVLAKNGSNGHYVGNRTSLADIKTAVAIEQLLNELYRFQGGDYADLINPTATPNLWKVRENVLSKDSYRQWRASEDFAKLKAVTQTLFDAEREQL
ncbi:hypothetical protein DFQ26_003603 [Actinomortierella ambigua]|nr:hypothetical protein DFQ26_003603 [Actinomortierella ambigua]